MKELYRGGAVHR